MKKNYNKTRKTPYILLMAVYYNVIPRRNMKDPEGPKLYYPVLRSIEALTEESAARRIALNSSINPKDALTVIYQLEAFMKEFLLLGHSIRLRDFGSFHLKFNSSGVATKEEVTVDLIRKVNLKFLPTEEFRSTLQEVEFIPVESLLSKLSPEEEP